MSQRLIGSQAPLPAPPAGDTIDHASGTSMRTVRRAAAIAAASSLLGACGNSSSNPTTPGDIATVIVAGTPPPAGTASQFIAIAVHSGGVNEMVTSRAAWRSSNTAIATVNMSGIVLGRRIVTRIDRGQRASGQLRDDNALVDVKRRRDRRFHARPRDAVSGDWIRRGAIARRKLYDADALRRHGDGDDAQLDPVDELRTAGALRPVRLAGTTAIGELLVTT